MQDSSSKIASSPSSYALDNVLGLIEDGVALIGAKKYNQACISLTQALQINKEMLLSDVAHSQQKDDEQEQARNCEESSSASGLSSQILSFVITRSTSGMVSLGDRFDDGSIMLDEDDNNCKFTDRRSIYVYSTPLAVMACDQGSELFRKAHSHDVQTILSVVIIFNLALTNHLYALDQTSNGCSFAKRRCLLGRAFALYQHSRALQFQLNLEACWFFSLMIINNEAHVLTLIGEHQEAEALLQGMLSGLCCLNQYYREEDHNDSSLPPIASLEGFSYNTSYLILKEVITAAAA